MLAKLTVALVVLLKHHLVLLLTLSSARLSHWVARPNFSSRTEANAKTVLLLVMHLASPAPPVLIRVRGMASERNVSGLLQHLSTVTLNPAAVPLDLAVVAKMNCACKMGEATTVMISLRSFYVGTNNRNPRKY
jgi:hypothetical protein